MATASCRKSSFPLLRTKVDFETGALPPTLVQPREDMRWAQHWVFLFPLWHGTMPALFKAFLEHIFRPGFALEYKKAGFPKRLLAGRSARIVVTMGMPVVLYRWYFGAYGLRSFERSMLSFAGIKPIRESLGLTFADEKKCARWIEDMRRRAGTPTDSLSIDRDVVK
jgi:putative NADPH-quinone reductase